MSFWDKTTHKYLYVKLCWNRSMSHINIPLSVFEKVMLVLIYLKLSNIGNLLITGIIISVLVLTIFVVGHLDIRHGLAEKEQSLSNKYNPELQELLKK